LCALRPAVRSCRARAFALPLRLATDGTRSRGRVGPSAVARYRPHPTAGLRALGPRPDSTGAGTTASSPAVASALPECGRADGRRFRRGRLRGPGRAARRSGNCPRPEWPPGCRGDRRFAVLTPGRPGSGSSSGAAALPAGRALELRRDGHRCRGHAVRGRRAARGVSVASGDGRDRLARVRPRTGPAGLALCSVAVAVCEAVHHRIPPGRAVSSPQRVRCVGDGRGVRRRPAVTGWVYGGERALTSRFTPELVCVGWPSVPRRAGQSPA
jgi:hypothetical protein